MINRILAYSDGECAGNPGPMSFRYTITFYNKAEIIHTIKEHHNCAPDLVGGTNNVAEYLAFMNAAQQILNYLRDTAPLPELSEDCEINFLADSKLIV